jgi:hypothetical protein
MCKTSARSAASLGPRGAFVTLARLLTGGGKAPHGPAQNTAPMSKPAGESILTPERLMIMGLMRGNRSLKQARIYAAKNQELMGKGASCDT